MYLTVGPRFKPGCSCTGLSPQGRSSPLLVRNSTISEEGVGEPSGAGNEQLQTARLIPKVKPREKWMRGDGPGEYGGPPINWRMPPAGGVKPKKDPLTSTDDYIWKQAWQPYVEAAPGDIKPPSPPEAEPESGFLSLNRAIALDSLDVDLSKELMQPSKATLERQVAAARRASLLESEAKRKEESKIKWRFAPTKREEEQWARATKAVSGGSEKLMRDSEKKVVDPVKSAAIARKKYQKLKQDLQITTLAIGGASLVGTYFSYSAEAAISYGTGLVGALVYIRMLGNSVDSVGASNAGGAMKGAMGQPRTLVPVLLVMLFNRWNAHIIPWISHSLRLWKCRLVVPKFDVIPLELIPMLVGFFTYKAATFVETFKEILPKSEEDDSDI